MKPIAAVFLLFLSTQFAVANDALDLLAEINLARTAPQQYAKKVEASAGRFRSRSSVTEAVRFLNKTKPLPPLDFSAGLTLAAQSHVARQGPSGGRGHGAMASRLGKRGQYVGSAGENIAYGLRTPAATVVAWIVDEGVAGRGHRRNIFGSGFKVAGSAIGSHARFGTMAVTDFAGGFVEKGTALAVRRPASFSNFPEL